MRNTFKIISKAGLLLLILIKTQSVTAQQKSIILGRPTDSAITASILFDQNMEYFLEYGTQSGNFNTTSAMYTNVADIPDEIELTNLTSNTKYYYRMQYKLIGATSYTTTPEYTFQTQRTSGNAFTFTVEADEHLYDVKGDRTMYQVTLANQAADHPDFMLSLGDIFGDDHTPETTTSADMDLLHKDYRQYLGQICHSIPFYVSLGNHEGENDFYYAQTPPNNICVWGTQWRKFYYPNPFPNSFYSGNTTVEPYGINSPENYYAWTWGDALFVVLDVYRTSSFTTLSDKPLNWNWTLGYTQYQWMRSVLENSTATHKFVFAHHTRGQGRGGIETATQFEWGGYQGAGNNYQFDANRPGWGKPIQKVFEDTGVDIFFQGHDHLFAKEQLNGVVYQEVPMPSDITYQIGYTANAAAYTDVTLDGTGHIRVNVTPDCVTVDYVKAYIPGTNGSAGHTNGEIGYTYSVGNCALGTHTNPTKTMAISVYPNPADERLNIEFSDKSTNHHYALVNIIGQTISEFTTNEFNTTTLPNGVYFLQIDGKVSQTKKIVIKH
ncbi:T9SS type A sorting domain-containing protein [Flavobacterium sp.]|uniref:T9SS type A sorting domain-containing protein n=1 Tax=Flavobacterium sp. TaxID=239 RepID=UPI002609D6AB|nr:T9SS type A sorting domain-containing protein [Flavobacterium sp.]